jgi:hypothetical protein
MRFAAAATILFAGAVMAAEGGEGPKYTTVTDAVTITSCAPEITECPFNKPNQPPVSTSQAAPVPSVSKGQGGGFASHNASVPTTMSTKVSPTGAPYPTGGWECDCDDESDEECTTSAPAGTGSAALPGTGAASPTGSNPGRPANNGTITTASPTSIQTAAANAAAPGLLAIAAGLIAFLA